MIFIIAVLTGCVTYLLYEYYHQDKRIKLLVQENDVIRYQNAQLQTQIGNCDKSFVIYKDDINEIFVRVNTIEQQITNLNARVFPTRKQNVEKEVIDLELLPKGE